MESGGIFGLVGLVLGYLLRSIDNWVLGRRDRAQRKADFRRDTLIKLQDALYETDTWSSEVARLKMRRRAGGVTLTSAGDPDPEKEFQHASNRVNKYRVRLPDAELSDAVLKFYGAAMREAIDTGGGSLMPVIESKQASLDRANERIGVLLDALH